MAKLYGCTLVNINAFLGHINLSSYRDRFYYKRLLSYFDHIFTDAKDIARTLSLTCHIMPATTVSNTIEKQERYQPLAQQRPQKIVLLVGSLRSTELKYYLNLFTELKQRGHAIHLMLVPRTLCGLKLQKLKLLRSQTSTKSGITKSAHILKVFLPRLQALLMTQTSHTSRRSVFFI